MRALETLKGDQALATRPGDDIWLSASAGTGKTYVLAARVLRLLLREGVRPDAILCLTFTKAGAAEMATRVHERLAHWVRLDEPALMKELFALGEDNNDPALLARARTLFASVLEARGGGLRVMTIHAFCQTLLGGFPLEAGLAPGFRPIEGREEAALAQTVLAELVVEAERGAEDRLIGDLQALSSRLGEDDARAFLARAARAHDALEGLGAGILPRVRAAFGVPLDFDPADVAAACGDGAFDREAVLELARHHADWNTATGLANADAISEWLLGTPEQRAEELGTLSLVWLTRDGGFRKGGPKHADYAPLIERLHGWCAELQALKARAELADAVASALHAGQRYARAYAEAKRVRGFVDFDDLIRLTQRLLGESGMGDWIRYKLDQATDHILVDEAQDTNADQWAIVEALAEEFYVGDGARGSRQRTIFTVGDFKQAIFGFQGTDPDHYRDAQKRFEIRVAGSTPFDGPERRLLQLSLDRSFRSSQPVLDTVDAVLAELGEGALGNIGTPHPHLSAVGGPGAVTLLQPVAAGEGDAGDEEGWIDDATRELSKQIAKQVRTWLDAPLWLGGKGKPLTAGDVMVLVRARGELAALLVARLHEEGVPVAGVDRLRLRAPLAVKDLLAALRFAVQPGDDLNLANLLVSPLIGWSQDDLFAVSHNRIGTLWRAVRTSERDDAPLRAMLAAADFATPFAFIEQLLSGPLQGRRKLLHRLGNEARDPIDELLNAALAFERDGIASLQGFLDWFDRGEGEVVRDARGVGDAVRVMTVHGAKGLEAPLVILADACADPERSRDRDFKLVLDDVELPLFTPRSAERELVESLERIAADRAERERREHWRLLYVAMTRATERLVVAGSLGPRARGVVPAESWHAAVQRALEAQGVEAADDEDWGRAWTFEGSEPARRPAASTSTAPPVAVERPDWLDRPAPAEARPPRPLAPSSIGADTVADPPSSPALATAAERGRLLHSLFERLPVLPPERRRAAALAVAPAEVVETALAVIEDPRFAAVFAPDALAEAPIAGVVDGLVIAGTVDRLCIGPDAVEVVDFKTGRRVPESVAQIPEHHFRQMAAYAAVLAGIFPGREIRASLLYTSGPVLHRLPQALLDAHKPGFAADQQPLSATG